MKNKIKKGGQSLKDLQNKSEDLQKSINKSYAKMLNLSHKINRIWSDADKVKKQIDERQGIFYKPRFPSSVQRQNERITQYNEYLQEIQSLTEEKKREQETYNKIVSQRNEILEKIDKDSEFKQQQKEREEKDSKYYETQKKRGEFLEQILGTSHTSANITEVAEEAKEAGIDANLAGYLGGKKRKAKKSKKKRKRSYKTLKKRK